MRLLVQPWSTSWPEYAPADITPPELQAPGIAASVTQGWVTDPTTDPTTIDYTERQAVALVPFDVVDGYPLNPAGRTGRTGRNLGGWAENAAADPIVIAGAGPDRQVLLIRRSDCGQWAIPGGMVDPGETAPAALVRELREETGVDLAQMRPIVLARTFVDDPRNTDHAWVCSTVALFRVSRQVEAIAGDDAVDARWFPLDDIDCLHHALVQAGGELYPAHLPLLTMATISAGGER
jgi:ADP-ribose pyrophosphatase